MPYEIKYNETTREANDERAIQDAREYLGKETFELVEQAMIEIETAEDFGELELVLRLQAGLSGYPVFALARKHCLAPFREWMHTGDDAVLTDEQGYSL